RGYSWRRQVREAQYSFALFTRICSGPSRNAGAEMMRGIGSRSDRAPDVTSNHDQEGADARRDRITHPAPARLWGLCVRGGGGGRDADVVGAPAGAGTVLRVWRVRDLGAGRPQL